MKNDLDILIEETTNALVEVIRGGPGSGFKGHAGRPGEVGGSQPSGADATNLVKSAEENLSSIELKVGETKNLGFYISPAGKIFGRRGSSFLGVHAAIANQALSGISDDELNELMPELAPDAPPFGLLDFLGMGLGFIRGHVPLAQDELNLDIRKPPTIKQMQSINDIYIAQNIIRIIMDWELGPDKFVEFQGQIEDFQKTIKVNRSIDRGGPGSGFFEHEGRPGEVGGSVPASGNGQKVVDGTSLPLAGETVDGRTVTENIPNLDSISATFTDWDEQQGIREVNLSEFGTGTDKPEFATVGQREAAESLAQSIKENGWIDPLIIVYDRDAAKLGPYILEGATRFDALRLLGAESFPALVVIDRDPQTGILERGGPGSGHHGHAGRPGEIGGSAPSGAVGGSSIAKIRNEVTAAYSGQINGTLFAEDENGEIIGHLDWSEFEDVVQVAMIFVSPEHRRQGIGTALMEQLQKEFEGQAIQAGMQTIEGTKFIEGIGFKEAKYVMATGDEQDAKLLNWHPESQRQIWITPSGYLNKLEQHLQPAYGERTLLNETSIEGLKGRMLQGLPIDAMWVDLDMETGEIQRQEGRHRAWAAIDLGIARVPVIEYYRHKEGWYADLKEDKVDTNFISPWSGLEMTERGGPGSGHRGHAGRPGEVGGSLPRSSGLTRAIQSHFGGWLGIKAGALPLMDIPLVSGFGYDDRHPSLLMVLKEIEEEIGGNDFETVYMLGDDGEILLVKKGGKDFVVLTDQELENAFDKILVHNHPSDNSFSTEDVMLMAGTGIKELVVAGKDGTRYMMRMLKKVNSIGATSDFFKKMNAVNKSLTSEWWDEINASPPRMTRQNASEGHYDELWTRFEYLYPDLIDYRVEQTSG